MTNQESPTTDKNDFTPEDIAVKAKQAIADIVDVMNLARSYGVNVNFNINQDELGSFVPVIKVTKDL